MSLLLSPVWLALAAILLITGAVTFCFYACWYYEARNFPELAALPGDDVELSRLQKGIGMTMEWLALSLLVITYPLRLLHDASPVRTRKPGETPIILVHGYGGDSANFLWMQWQLKRRGWHNVYAVSYTPPTINARELAQQVTNHVERILAATGAEKAHLVCHSMGGPLTRYALLHLGLAGKVDKVITLGSPHKGSRIANLFMARGAAAQMRYQSKFIQELHAAGETPGGARFYSIFSNLDNFVLPVSTAVLGGNARNYHVPRLGHVSLLYSPKVLAVVEDCLRDGQPDTDGATSGAGA